MIDNDDAMHVVLDHGFVRLVDCMGDDLSIVRAARVSYASDWRTGKEAGADEKLIRYLWTNRHTSPFEACYMTFEIKCPIFIARQWHRHRTQSYNEVSARYTELPEEFYVPRPAVIGTQSTSNKQMREVVAENDRARQISARIDLHAQDSFALYRTLIKLNCPRELARAVLPMNTYTRFFASMNLLNCFRFLELRLHEHAQYEIQVYALSMLKLIRARWPVAVAAFEAGLE